MNRSIVGVIKLFLISISFLLMPFGLAEENIPQNSLFASEPLKISFPVPESIIQFFYVGEGDDKSVEVFILSPDNKNYKNIYVGSIGPEGGAAHIESVFLFNIDASPEKELFILARWEINHSGLDTHGNYYKTYVFSSMPSQNNMGLKRLNDIEKKIGSGFDGYREGEKVTYPYKTASAIKSLLKKIEKQ